MIPKIFTNFVTDLGVKGTSSLFPRDFEVYMVAIELVDGNDKTIDYLMFPVMPSNISKANNERTSIQKTLRGTTIINSNSFVPKDLTISGNFGRGFKIISKDKLKTISAGALQYSIDSGKYNTDDLNNLGSLKVPSISRYLKTGYGLIKELESILDKAKGFSREGTPFKLIVYNPALGENYLCALTKSPLTLRQDESQNMIWSYTINLKIVGNISNLRLNIRSLTDQIERSAINKAVDKTAKSLLKWI